MQKKVDVAIIECGLGGRLDSTNIIKPILSIITSISLDHSNILGDNIMSITKEKAGIIKKNTPVLISSQNNDDTIKYLVKKANELSSPLHISNKITQDVTNLNSPTYQLFNIELVKSAQKILSKIGFKSSSKKSEKIIESYYNKTSFLGRWTKIYDKPLIICDIAHNFQGLKSVFLQLKKEKRKKHIILGFSADKNLNEIFKIINLDATYYFCSSTNQRVLEPENYISLINSLNRKYFIYNNSVDVVRSITDKISKDDMIFVTGSTFIVADVLSIFR